LQLVAGAPRPQVPGLAEAAWAITADHGAITARSQYHIQEIRRSSSGKSRPSQGWLQACHPICG
jgi:hypothetical protein